MQPLDSAFGPVRAWVHTKSARGEPKPAGAGMGTAASWFIRTVLKARFNGDYKINPFFDMEKGSPIATPKVLTGAEHSSLMSSVRAGTA